MNARRLAYAVGIFALVSSGVYLFVYLYRWEWNRAQISGAIFIAAEIALVAGLVSDRLRRIDNRLDHIQQLAERNRTLENIQDAAPPPRRHFAWLSDSNDGLNVFVPVLMGAGVVVSGLAWLIEKVASKTARPVLEERLVARLAPISFPASDGPAPRFDTKALRATGRRAAINTAVLLTLAAAAIAGIDELGDLTQARSDPIRLGQSTSIVLDVTTTDADIPTAAGAATSLWGACRGTTSSDLTKRGMTRVAGNRIALELHPALGPYAEQRLRGCLEDATLDGIQATVVRFRSVQAATN